MHVLLDLTERYRDSRALYFVIWCIIGVGIVPAIVTDGILPFGMFSYRFGIEIGEVIFLPKNACLLIFLLGLVACLAQRRHMAALLLLPWLALYLFDIEQLTFRLPAYSQAQDVLRANYQSSRENVEPPQAQQLIALLGQIEHPNNPIWSIPVEITTTELEQLKSQLGEILPAYPESTMSLILKIGGLSAKIDAADEQIAKVKATMGTAGLVTFFGAGLADENLGKMLEKSLEEVVAQRAVLVEQRSELRAALDDRISPGTERTRLYELRAEVASAIWASQSYETWRVSQFYKSVCFLALLVLIWKFSLSSWLFLLTLGVSSLVSLAYVEAPPAFRLWVVVKFLAAAWVIRALYRLAVENYPLLRDQPNAFLLRTLGKTLLYYWLFILLIASTIVTSHLIDRYIDKAVYSFEHMAQFEPGENPRRLDIDVGIDTYFATREADALVELDEFLRQKPKPGVKEVAAKTNAIFAEAFEPTLPQMNAAFTEPDCGGFLPWVFDTADCAESAAKRPVNDGYAKERKHYADALKASTDSYSAKAGRNADKAASIAKQDLHQNLLDMRLELKARLHQYYSVIDFWYWVSLLVFILVILKSLLYIYARLFFSANESGPGRAIQFEPTANPQQHGSVMEKAKSIKLTDKLGECFYVNKRYDFANAPPDEVTPQPHKAFFSRFASKTWHMNRIRPADRDEPEYAPYRRIPSDEHIIVWRLKPGDAVIFSWRNFVGMNENIRIRTRFSWQLSSLVLGRMFYVVAFVEPDTPADGTLMLVARGSDGVLESSQPANSPDQLLAWQTTTRFQLHAHLSMRNVYRSGIQIRAVDSDLAVMHQDPRRRKSGAASFLKYFLIPV